MALNFLQAAGGYSSCRIPAGLSKLNLSLYLRTRQTCFLTLLRMHLELNINQAFRTEQIWSSCALLPAQTWNFLSSKALLVKGRKGSKKPTTSFAEVFRMGFAIRLFKHFSHPVKQISNSTCTETMIHRNVLGSLQSAPTLPVHPHSHPHRTTYFESPKSFLLH